MAVDLKNRCPFCGYQTDAATSPEDAPRGPGYGDLSLCLRCGEWSIFGARLLLRRPTDADFDAIAADPQCRAIREAWVRVEKLRKAERGA